MASKKKVIKHFPIKRSPGLNRFTSENYHTLKKKKIPIFLKLFQKIEEEICETSINMIPKPDKTVQKKVMDRLISLMHLDAKSTTKYVKTEFSRSIYHHQDIFISGVQGKLNIQKLISVICHRNRV